MANYSGFLDGAMFISDQTENGNRLNNPGDQGINGPPQWQIEDPAEGNLAEILGDNFISGTQAAGTPTPAAMDTFSGAIATMPQDDFFEQIIVSPSILAYGLVLALETKKLNIYNAFRSTTRALNTFVSNAGAGVTVNGLPGLPANILAQTGLALTVDVSEDGPPSVNGTLDFTFDTGLQTVLVTAQRGVILPYEPVIPLRERIRSKTDVLRHAVGTEQRIKLREVPRQLFDLTFEVSGFDRQALEAILFDSQAGSFGVPLWFEPSVLTQAASISDLTITVDTTDFGDFRVGSLAIIWSDSTTFEALEVDSLTSTTITFTSILTKPFVIGTRVMPVRIAFARESNRSEKFPVNLSQMRIQFQVLDNDVDQGSTAAFPTFNSKVLLDEANPIAGTLSESWTRKTTVIDNEVGLFETFTDDPVTKRGFAKTFFCNSRQRLWEVRQLLHALSGKQTSFYIPSFFPEMTPTAGITSGSQTIKVENFGYTVFIKNQQPRNIIQVIKNDGTKIIRTVTTSIENSPTEETLTVDSTWGTDVALADFTRVEFIEEVRMDSDDVTITHTSGIGDATVRVPVVAVLE